METIPHDIIIYILMPLLEDKDKLSFMQQNKITSTHIRSKTILDTKYYEVQYIPPNAYIKKALIVYNVDLHTIILPQSVTMIKFDDAIDRYIPPIFFENNKNIQDIIFGARFNQTIKPDVLPATLNKLEFGHDYDQYIEVGVLPVNLKKLIFKHHYSQCISAGVLPSNLESLEFWGWVYDQQLDMTILPISLKTLVIDRNLISFALLPSIEIIHPNNIKECDCFDYDYENSYFYFDSNSYIDSDDYDNDYND
jgi:hypothetical protein